MQRPGFEIRTGRLSARSCLFPAGSSVYRKLQSELRLALASMDRAGDGPEPFAKQHEELFRALRAGDTALSLRLVDGHLAGSEEAIRSAVHAAAGASSR